MVTDPLKEASRESPALTVLYDGACPLCRREIGLYRGLQPLQPDSPVCFADVSDTALPLPPGTTREQLLAHVWGYPYGGDGRLVDTHVARLRSKVDDPDAPASVIQTVRGLGYRAGAGDV